MKISISNIML